MSPSFILPVSFRTASLVLCRTTSDFQLSFPTFVNLLDSPFFLLFSSLFDHFTAAVLPAFRSCTPFTTLTITLRVLWLEKHTPQLTSPPATHRRRRRKTTPLLSFPWKTSSPAFIADSSFPSSLSSLYPFFNFFFHSPALPGCLLLSFFESLFSP